MIEVGQKVRFDPFATNKDSVEKIRITVVGTVVYVNKPHHWFSVMYNENQRTSFNFSEIGDSVRLCK